MNIPKYWEKKEVTFHIDGKEAFCNIWGYSDGNMEAARRMIEEKIPQVEEAIRRRWDSEDGEYYTGYKGEYYTVDVIREQRLEEISQDSDEIAVITRNSYGAKIINCPEVMFVDIDTDEEPWFTIQASEGCLGVIFGMTKEPNQPEEDPADPPAAPELSKAKIEALARVKSYVDSNPGTGFRIYETTLGLRLIATNQVYDPAGDATMEVLQDLNCDELYLRLCRVQKCFRARLTPKPWRIGHMRPPAGNRKPNNPSNPRSPEPAKDPEYIRWLESYEARSDSYQACHFMEKIGMEAPEPAIREVVRVHDANCGVTGDLQLR